MKALIVALVLGMLLMAGCAWLDQPENQQQIVDGVQTATAVAGAVGVPAASFWGSVLANAILLGLGIYNKLRGDKAIGDMAVAIESKRAPEGKSNEVDAVVGVIKSLGNSLIDKVVAKVTK